MRIIAALFIEDLEMRQVPGPSTRIDLTGVHFSAPALSPVPVTVTPHLIVMVHCPVDADGFSSLEVTFHRDDEQIARNVQPVQVEPGRFGYRLVRAELEFPDYGTVEARCRLAGGDPVIVPYTLMPPVEDGE